MKEYKQAEEIYADFPRLKEIADRLALSEKEADEYNNNAKRTPDASNPASSASRTTDRRKHPEYFKITRWWSRNGNGNLVPNTTPFVPMCGEKNFNDKLSHVLRTYKPVGIEVFIYAGRKFNIAPAYEEQFWFDNEVGEDEKNAASEKSAHSQAIESTEKTAAMLAGFEQKLKELEKPAGTGEDLRLKIIQMQFTEQLKDMKFDQEKKDLVLKYEGQLREIQDELRDSEDYIKELEDELGEQDSTLNGLAKQVEERQQPSTIQKILAGAIENAGIGILKKYPKFTEAISGVSPESQNELWKEFMQSQPGGGEGGGGSDASFSEASSSGDGYDGLTQDHKEMCMIIHEVCKGVDIVTAQKIYAFFVYIASDDGKSIVPEKMEKAYTMISMLQKKEPQNPQN